MATSTSTADVSPGGSVPPATYVVIPRQEWVTQLNAFTRTYEGWLVSLDVFARNAARQREFENVPLLGVSADRLNHDGTIAISVAWSRSEHLTHIVRTVTGVTLETRPDGVPMALSIESLDRTRTVLRFRVARPPEQVDGIVRAHDQH